MLKRVVYILIVSLAMFLLTGCYSSEESKLAKQYREQGKINALNYVNKKYGFNVKVKSVEEEEICSALWGCMDSSPNGNVIVKLNANDKDFFVYVTGEEASTDAYDDYGPDAILHLHVWGRHLRPGRLLLSFGGRGLDRGRGRLLRDGGGAARVSGYL